MLYVSLWKQLFWMSPWWFVIGTNLSYVYTLIQSLPNYWTNELLIKYYSEINSSACLLLVIAERHYGTTGYLLIVGHSVQFAQQSVQERYVNSDGCPKNYYLGIISNLLYRDANVFLPVWILTDMEEIASG